MSSPPPGDAQFAYGLAADSDDPFTASQPGEGTSWVGIGQQILDRVDRSGLDDQVGLVHSSSLLRAGLLSRPTTADAR